MNLKASQKVSNLSEGGGGKGEKRNLKYLKEVGGERIGLAVKFNNININNNNNINNNINHSINFKINYDRLKLQSIPLNNMWSFLNIQEIYFNQVWCMLQMCTYFIFPFSPKIWKAFKFYRPCSYCLWRINCYWFFIINI